MVVVALQSAFEREELVIATRVTVRIVAAGVRTRVVDCATAFLEVEKGTYGAEMRIGLVFQHQGVPGLAAEHPVLGMPGDQRILAQSQMRTQPRHVDVSQQDFVIAAAKTRANGTVIGHIGLLPGGMGDVCEHGISLTDVIAIRNMIKILGSEK